MQVFDLHTRLLRQLHEPFHFRAFFSFEVPYLSADAGLRDMEATRDQSETLLIGNSAKAA
jgi:hypothetical protein